MSLVFPAVITSGPFTPLEKVEKGGLVHEMG